MMKLYLYDKLNIAVNGKVLTATEARLEKKYDNDSRIVNTIIIDKIVNPYIHYNTIYTSIGFYCILFQ